MADFKSKLQQTATQQTNAPAKQKTIYDMVASMKGQIEKALPKHMNPDRLLRIMTTEMRKNPRLAECEPMSLLGSLMLSAQLGLEPGPLGHCYLIPFKRECQFIIGYKGMIDLARRSGDVSVIYAETVCENDKFEFGLGLDPYIKHEPALTNRGRAVAWYGVAKFKDGGFYIKVMGPDEIESHRMRSKSENSNFSPWRTDFNEMAQKTVIRAMFRYLPVSPEIREIGVPDEGIIKAKEIGEDGFDLDVEYSATVNSPAESPAAEDGQEASVS
jgi:recombination protein RecT